MFAGDRRADRSGARVGAAATGTTRCRRAGVVRQLAARVGGVDRQLGRVPVDVGVGVEVLDDRLVAEPVHQVGEAVVSCCSSSSVMVSVMVSLLGGGEERGGQDLERLAHLVELARRSTADEPADGEAVEHAEGEPQRDRGRTPGRPRPPGTSPGSVSSVRLPEPVLHLPTDGRGARARRGRTGSTGTTGRSPRERGRAGQVDRARWRRPRRACRSPRRRASSTRRRW